MRCRQLEPYIVDLARATREDLDNTQIAQHVLQCPSCSAVLERELAMSSALRRLAATIGDPPHHAQDEQALLARFDDIRTRTAARRNSPIWMGVAAAGLLVVASLVWQFARQPTSPRVNGPSPADAAVGTEARAAALISPAIEQAAPVAFEVPETSGDDVRAEAPFETADFVVWPGAAAWPPFESGQLIRVDLPIDLLPSLGFGEPEADAAVVQADVLIGQDGFARAIRLVQ